jgi:hydroxyethylthiazole kinase
MSNSPGAALRDLRERKPLIHQITNYVVMNETANATLAIGALPVMAHAVEEVEEMASAAGALVLNIGTLSRHWIDAMLLAGRAANAAGVPVVLDPVGVGATALRTETARLILAEVDVAIVRGNAAEIAALAGLRAEIRGVEAIGAEIDAGTIARTAASGLDVVASVTGPVDHVSDGTRTLAVANGDPLLATITGSGCMATAMTGCFAAVRPDALVEAAAAALAAFGVAAEDAARGAGGPGTFHARLYDTLYALTPDALDERANIGDA